MPRQDERATQLLTDRCSAEPPSTRLASALASAQQRLVHNNGAHLGFAAQHGLRKRPCAEPAPVPCRAAEAEGSDQLASIGSEKRTVNEAELRVAIAASPSATQN